MHRPGRGWSGARMRGGLAHTAIQEEESDRRCRLSRRNTGDHCSHSHSLPCTNPLHVQALLAWHAAIEGKSMSCAPQDCIGLHAAGYSRNSHLDVQHVREGLDGAGCGVGLPQQGLQPLAVKALRHAVQRDSHVLPTAAVRDGRTAPSRELPGAEGAGAGTRAAPDVALTLGCRPPAAPSPPEGAPPRGTGRHASTVFWTAAGGQWPVVARAHAASRPLPSPQRAPTASERVRPAAGPPRGTCPPLCHGMAERAAATPSTARVVAPTCCCCRPAAAC